MNNTESHFPQRILVTGGAGFIGSHTVNFLLNQGKKVIVLDNLSSGKLNHLPVNHPNLNVIQDDILNYRLIEKLVLECDAILHLAAIPSVQQSIENPLHTFQVNTQGLLHVLQAIQVSKRHIRLVYASSAAVYGNAKHLPCRDDIPLLEAPLSPYALHKINNEEYAKIYFKLHAMSSLGLRYFNVYGPKQDPKSPYSGVISYFIHAYKKEMSLNIFGDGKQSRDFIYIEDVVRANWLALHSDFTGVLNIATGQPQTILQMIEHIEKAGQKKAKYICVPERAGDIKHSCADVKMAKYNLNFVSSVSLEGGLQKLLLSEELL